jgi:hypothetical protein
MQRFSIDDVTLPNRKSVNLVVAVKLHGPCPRAIHPPIVEPATAPPATSTATTLR